MDIFHLMFFALFLGFYLVLLIVLVSLHLSKERPRKKRQRFSPVKDIHPARIQSRI
ncbi:MAG TPA: hypothetical protein PLU41_06870 [Acidobacteriota bacterium]|jgi:hypothetical protein|nr:hypothetical protein [Acidobacteriota bacterium]HQP73730.1 hypothetical protein [Acidobacteriota bacterium]